MIKNRWWNPKLNAISFCIVLVLLYLALRFVLMRYDIASSIFAAGGHVPLWMLTSAVIFIFLRVAVILLIPSLAAWRLARWIVEKTDKHIASHG